MRHALIVLLSTIAFFIASSAHAQVQSYYYIGDNFDVPTCQSLYPSAQCPAGELVGSITFNIPPGYTGGAGASNIIGLDFSSPAGSVNTAQYGSSSFSFTNGHMDSFYLVFDSSNIIPYSEVYAQDQGVGTRNSFAFTLDSSGNIAKYGTVNDGRGMVSAQSLGIACVDQAPADSPPQSGQAGWGTRSILASAICTSGSRTIRRSGRTRFSSRATTTACRCRTLMPCPSARTGGTLSIGICTSLIRRRFTAQSRSGQTVSMSAFLPIPASTRQASTSIAL
jgi:hypothetical protein